MYFEMQLVLLRLAWETYPKDLEKKELSMILERYLKFLYLRKDEEVGRASLPEIQRKMIGKMKEYYKIINNEVHSEGENQQQGQPELTPFEQLANKMQKELMNTQSLDLDYV